MCTKFTFLVLLSLLASAFDAHIITKTINVPHLLFDLNENNTRSTTVPFTLYARAPVHSRPLVIILPGALVPASDYELLSSALSYRGFIVAVPQYDQRNLPIALTSPNVQAHLNFTSHLKPPCPINGHFISAALLSSFFTHVTERSHLHWLLRKILVDRTVIFGHSFGGSAAFLLISGQCANVNPLELSRFSFSCEKAVPLPPPARIVGLALFEGLPRSILLRFPIPGDLFISVMNSKFNGNEIEVILQPNGNLVEALISDTNHFGPNDFTNETMMPPCALPRPSEAMFRTNFRTQRTVISTIATIVSRSYLVFFKGRDENILTSMPSSYPRVQSLSIS